MPTVVHHLLAAAVLAGHQELGPGQPGALQGLAPRPRDRTDHGGLALDLHAVQLGVLLTRVDHHRDPGVALHVGPSLAAGERVDPQGFGVPHEPDR